MMAAITRGMRIFQIILLFEAVLLFSSARKHSAMGMCDEPTKRQTTAILQFYATDVGLSAAVVWNFGDLGRATYRTDLIMLITVGMGLAVFLFMSGRYDALLSGDAVAVSIGVNVKVLRFVSMLLSSMITAVCVSFLGIIGFVGIICPHILKKFFGQEHFWSISASALSGSLLLLMADTLSRSMGNGSALPVGAITAMLGAPFFIAIIFSKGRRR